MTIAEYEGYDHLIKVDVSDGEPLADKDDDGSAEPVHATLVEATDARHLAEVFCARASKKPLVSVDNTNEFC